MIESVNHMEKDSLKAPLYEQIADLLEKRITSEEYSNGSRLPSEQQLCEEMGVSRTILREALKLLKERGLIDTRTGSGAYATRPEAHNITDVVSRIINIDRINYIDVFDVRTILEVESAALAAQNAREDQLQKLRLVMEEFRNAGFSNEEQAERDFRFHFLVAEASGNPLLALLVQAMGGICRNTIEKTSMILGSMDDAIIRHGKIYEAIEARDPEAARIAAKDHLEESKRRYKTYIADKTAEL